MTDKLNRDFLGDFSSKELVDINNKNNCFVLRFQARVLPFYAGNLNALLYAKGWFFVCNTKDKREITRALMMRSRNSLYGNIFSYSIIPRWFILTILARNLFRLLFFSFKVFP